MDTDDGTEAAGAASGPVLEPGGPEMLRAVVETTVNPYVVLDGAGSVVWCSDRIEALLGSPAASYVGRHFLEMIDPSSHEAAIAEYAQFTAPDGRRQPWVGPPMLLDVLHADGTPVTCEVAASTAVDHGLDGVVVQIRRWRGTVLLYAAVDALAAGEPLAVVLRRLAAIADHDMPGSAVFVAAGWDGNRFELVEAAPDTPPEHLARRDDLIDLPEQAWAADRAGWSALEDLAERTGFDSCWAIPITVRGDLAPSAALVLLRPIPGPAPHNTTVERIARLASLAIESDRNRRSWRRSAITDHLTQLANRTGLEEWLAERARTAPDDPIAVLFCDVDEFKQVNDDLGHAAGDRILQVLAERMRRSVRDQDLVARWGGDEFVVVCRDPEAAEGLAGRLIQHVEQPVALDDGAVRVGLSVGIAPGTLATPLDDLLRDSDRALLDAKGQGRSRYVLRG